MLLCLQKMAMKVNSHKTNKMQQNNNTHTAMCNKTLQRLATWLTNQDANQVQTGYLAD